MSGAPIAINWPRVLARCRPEVHKKLMGARSRHEELHRLIVEARTQTPSIDFGAYRRALPASAAALVDELEGGAKAFQPKKIETGPLLQALETERVAKVHPHQLARLSSPAGGRL